MARWLLGLKNDVTSAQKTFRMLTAFIKQNGDLLDHKRLSPAEMSWLRMSAGTAMLKICEQKGVGDQFNAEQFYTLSQLMVDPVPEVREIIGKKLHKGLNKGIPLKSLPLDFMGFYVLGGRETDRRLSQLLKAHIEADVNRRREFIKSFATVERAMRQLPHILPDYMLLFAITVLTHDPNFNDPKSFSDLKGIEKCLWLILEPLIKNKEFFCFAFYKNIIDKLKNHRNAYKQEDEASNIKMWTICDMAMHLIYTKATNYDTREFPLESRIPDMFFVLPKEELRNTKSYLPPELYSISGLPMKLASLSTMKPKINTTTTNNTSNRSNDRSENGDQLELVERLEEDDNDMEVRHNDDDDDDDELLDGDNDTMGIHDEELVDDEDEDEDYGDADDNLDDENLDDENEFED
jgi:sister-chromatid-cohesion protein PDS5